MSEGLTSEAFVESGHRVIRLRGELDLATMPVAQTALSEGFDTIDFSELTFLDSSGLSVLLQACGGRARRPIARGLNGQVRRLLDLTGLAAMFEIDDAEGSVRDCG